MRGQLKEKPRKFISKLFNEMSWCVVWFRESFCVCGTTTLLQATTFCVSLILWRTLLNEFWCVGLKTSNFKFSKRFVKTSKVKTSNWNYWELELLQLKNVENVLKSLKFYIFKNVKFDNFIFSVFAFYDLSVWKCP